MCDEIPRREKHDEQKDGCPEFHANASFIIKKSYLRFVKGYPREESIPSWPKAHECIYPKANAYYAYHEDTNPFIRFAAKCQSRRYGNVEPHFEPSTAPYTIRDPYHEAEARKKYLKSKPTCFAVLGKPDLNTAKLAAMIADSWNCVLISPLALINQEIEQGTERGKILVDILKTGECLGPDIIAHLVTNRLNKRDVFHRGYVVEGLPMFPNWTLDYSSYPENIDEEANVSENLKKFFDSPFRRVCKVTEPEDDHDGASNVSQEIVTCHDRKGSETCATKSDYEHFIPSQLEEIFTTWPLKPSIIVYAMCPDEDFAKKREQFRLDPKTDRTVDMSVAKLSKYLETLYFHDKVENNMNISFELYQQILKDEQMLDENQQKYLLRRLSDRKLNVETQCKLYKRLAMPVIEKWILLHNPQNVIRVDGRTALSLMFQVVVSRLRVLPVSRAIFPRKLLDRATLAYAGESPIITMNADEFEEMSNEEAFQELAIRETVSPLFPWGLSAWNYLCPVELAKGRTTEGTPKHAVQFMNKLFFLSSDEAVDLFIENPRTFLFPFTPRPTCKIAVFGPKYSGKSDLCSKLARMLRGSVINVNEIGKSLTDVDSDVSFNTWIDETLEDKTNMILETIQGVPKQEIDIEVWRDGGYIVDGMCPKIDCWKAIVEDGEIIFEDVILLFDEDPYKYLISKWNNIHDRRHDGEFEGERMEDFESDEDEEEETELSKYLRHIQKFESDWGAIEETVVDACRNFIPCDVGKIEDVLGYVMDQIKERYVDKARVMSEEEKERERNVAEYIAMADTEDVEDEEQEVGEAGGEVTESDVKEDNRRFGDSKFYCPVSLLKHNAFWKGKEEFSAIYTDKIYHLSSAEALQEFIRGPYKLGLPLRKPLSLLPPLRVAIIGPIGSGKTTLANAISREYGLAHIDHFDSFTTYMASRGMPPISHKSVLISPQDLLDEVELPEDLNNEKYNSDTATVQTFVRLYWNTGHVLPEKMLKECLLQFYRTGMYNQSGIVHNQFPSCTQDVEIMLQHYTVPDMILELSCSEATATQRMIPVLIEAWQNDLDERRHAEDLRYESELEAYEKERDTWIAKMLTRSRRRNADDHEGEGEYMEEYTVNDDMDLEERGLTQYDLEEMWYQQNPQPQLFTDWEEFETAKKRIEEGFRIKYENESWKVDAVRIALENESIPYTVVNTEGNLKHILLKVMRILDPYVRRDVVLLEKTYTVDLETAETLLDCGYYLFSSFGRWCPVQLHRNKTPVQMFQQLEARQEIYPVIHRHFIYFLGGKDAQMAFSENPFKYLEQDSCAPIVPFRLSIIGPPKCGKTTLARRFAEKYGVKVITRGSSLRHAIKYFSWTNWIQTMECRLRAGQLAPAECVRLAVEAFSIDPNSISRGFVLDGFPLNRKEYEDLAFLDLQPMITLDLKADLAFCLDCLSQEADHTKKPPNFSGNFLTHRYAAWEIDQGSYRSWLKNFSQNVIELNATKCKWNVWSRADEQVCSRYTIIRSYFRESDYDKVHGLTYMSVSPYEFKRRQSRFESFCPVCLSDENIMTTSRSPPMGHEGMVQFREHFYWICPKHMNEFIEKPHHHIPPANNAYLSRDRPRILTEPVDPEHSCWSKRLQVGGFCLVTYVDSLPSRKLVPGLPTLGVLYKNKVYLFCTEECRDKFLARPEEYARIDVKFLRTLPSVDVHALPDLGFLEQTVAKLIIDAVNQISVSRPKLPGLSPSITAAIYVGVYLKACNESCALKDTEIYKTVHKRLLAYEEIIHIATQTMKKRLNPFIQKPKYLNVSGIPCKFDELSMISRVFRPNLNNSIIFHRTSPTQILDDPNNCSTDD